MKSEQQHRYVCFCLNTDFSIRYGGPYKIWELKRTHTLCQGRAWDPTLAAALGTSPLLLHHAEGHMPFFCNQALWVKGIKGFGTSYCRGLYLVLSLTRIHKYSLFAFTPESHNPSHAAARAAFVHMAGSQSQQSLKPKHTWCFTDQQNFRDTPMNHMSISSRKLFYQVQGLMPSHRRAEQ